MKRTAALILTLILVISFTSLSRAEVNKAAQDARYGVVRVLSLYDDYGQQGASTGSGFAIGNPGEPVCYFVTNNHVINNYQNEAYIILDEIYDEHDQFCGIRAEVIATWESPDIAILQIRKPIEDRVALPLGTAKTTEVTQTVYALGFPGVADYLNDRGDYLPSSIDDITLTTGTITKQKVEFNSSDCIGIDASINHGNSGGPLVNELGQVIGINTYGLEGSNLAVYIDYVTKYCSDNEIPYYTDVLSDTEEPQGFSISKTGWIIIIIVAVLLAGGGVLLLVTMNSRRRPAIPQHAAAPQPIQQQPIQQQPVQQSAQQPLWETAPTEVQPAPQPVGQAVRAGATEPAKVRQPPSPGYGAAAGITGVSGLFTGNVFPVTDRITIGRDPSRCQLVYPPKTAGISSLHCELIKSGGVFELYDRGSTYGTFLANGTKLETNRPYMLNTGDSFYLGDRSNMFRVT